MPGTLCIFLFLQSPQALCRIVSISAGHWKKLKPREITELVQGHTAREGQTQHRNLRVSSLTGKCSFLTTSPWRPVYWLNCSIPVKPVAVALLQLKAKQLWFKERDGWRPVQVEDMWQCGTSWGVILYPSVPFLKEHNLNTNALHSIFLKLCASKNV